MPREGEGKVCLHAWVMGRELLFFLSRRRPQGVYSGLIRAKENSGIKCLLFSRRSLQSLRSGLREGGNR